MMYLAHYDAWNDHLPMPFHVLESEPSNQLAIITRWQPVTSVCLPRAGLINCYSGPIPIAEHLLQLPCLPVRPLFYKKQALSGILLHFHEGGR